MALISAERSIEQVFERHAPGGLWAGLAQAADAPTLGTGDVWRGIERRPQPACGPRWRSRSTLHSIARTPCRMWRKSRSPRATRRSRND